MESFTHFSHEGISNQNNPNPSQVVLYLGILSVDKPINRLRRDTIRKAYDLMRADMDAHMTVESLDHLTGEPVSLPSLEYRFVLSTSEIEQTSNEQRLYGDLIYAGGGTDYHSIIHKSLRVFEAASDMYNATLVMKCDDDSLVNVRQLIRTMVAPSKEGGVNIEKECPQNSAVYSNSHNGWSHLIKERIETNGALAMPLLYGGCSNGGRPPSDPKHRWYDPSWPRHFGVEHKKEFYGYYPSYLGYYEGAGYFVSGALARVVTSLDRDYGIQKLTMEDASFGMIMAPFKATRINFCKKFSIWRLWETNSWSDSFYRMSTFDLSAPGSEMIRDKAETDWCKGDLLLIHAMKTVRELELVSSWTAACQRRSEKESERGPYGLRVKSGTKSPVNLPALPSEASFVHFTPPPPRVKSTSTFWRLKAKSEIQNARDKSGKDPQVAAAIAQVQRGGWGGQRKQKSKLFKNLSKFMKRNKMNPDPTAAVNGEMPPVQRKLTDKTTTVT